MNSFQITILWLCAFAVFSAAVLLLIFYFHDALKENEYRKGYEKGKEDGESLGRECIMYNSATEAYYILLYESKEKRYFVSKIKYEYDCLRYLSSGNLFLDKKVAMHWCDEMNKALLEGTTESTWNRIRERDLLTINGENHN